MALFSYASPYGGGAPSYGAEGEGPGRGDSESDVGIGEASTAALPLRPFGPPPPDYGGGKTKEGLL